MSAFKKYDKVGGFNDNSKPFVSPMLSPGLMNSAPTPQMASLNPFASL